MHFLGALVIYQNLKERVNDIQEKKEEFFKFRNLIFHNLLEKLRGAQPITIERICYSISILMVIGLITYWPECMEDIIQFAKISKENCYLATLILENLNKELFDLSISHKTLLRIKDTLIDKKILIQDFIFLILTNVGSRTEQDPEEKNKNIQLFNHTLLLTQAWIKLGLNVLKIPLLSQILLNYINSDNIKYISEIFSDSIAYSNNSKYYSVNEEYDLDQIINRSDKEELQSINNLIEMIKSLLINLGLISENLETSTHKNLSIEEYEILNGIANIFSSITENYIYLIFTKNSFSFFNC